MARINHNRVKNWLLFNATGFLAIPITLSASGFNMAFFAKKNRNVANARIVDTQGAGPSDGFSIVEQASGASAYNFRNGAGATSNQLGKVYDHAETVHYAITYDGTESKIYENGILVGTDSSSVMSTPTVTVSIGRRSGGGNAWLGKLGELVIHNTDTPWTLSEVESLYKSGTIPSGASYWMFASNVLDGSGNGHDGTLTGGSYISTDAERTTVTSRDAVKQNYEEIAGTLFEGFETFADWSKQSAGGTIADETSIVKEGFHSLKLTPASASNVFADKTISTTLTNAGVIGLWLNVPSLTGLTSVAIYLSSVTDYSKFFLRTITVSMLHEGWNYIEISRNDWSNTGSESWSNTFQRLRVRVNASAGTPPVYFDSIYTGEKRKAKVLITFDDSWDSQYSKAFSYMESLGLKGTIYVIGGRIDTANYMTLAQCQEVYNAGWDLGTHGDVNLTTLATQSEMEAEIGENKDFLTSNGFTNRNCHLHYAYPNGGYNDTAKLALSSLGYITARTIIDTTQSHLFAEPYLMTRQAIYNTTTVAAAKAFIDKAIERGNTIWLNFHLIVDATADTSTKVLTADFNSIMDYVYQKKMAGQIDVPTTSEWYNGLEGRQTATSRTSV